ADPVFVDFEIIVCRLRVRGWRGCEARADKQCGRSQELTRRGGKTHLNVSLSLLVIPAGAVRTKYLRDGQAHFGQGLSVRKAQEFLRGAPSFSALYSFTAR